MEKQLCVCVCVCGCHERLLCICWTLHLLFLPPLEPPLRSLLSICSFISISSLTSCLISSFIFPHFLPSFLHYFTFPHLSFFPALSFQHAFSPLLILLPHFSHCICGSQTPKTHQVPKRLDVWFITEKFIHSVQVMLSLSVHAAENLISCRGSDSRTS